MLREAFALPWDEVATALDRTAASCRQLHVRARAQARRPPAGHAPVPARRALLDRFLALVATADLAGLTALLTEDAVLVSDGGGLVSAARRPVVGADRVARFLLGLAARVQPGQVLEVGEVNGGPCAAAAHGRRRHPRHRAGAGRRPAARRLPRRLAGQAGAGPVLTVRGPRRSPGPVRRRPRPRGRRAGRRHRRRRRRHLHPAARAGAGVGRPRGAARPAAGHRVVRARRRRRPRRPGAVRRPRHAVAGGPGDVDAVGRRAAAGPPGPRARRPGRRRAAARRAVRLPRRARPPHAAGAAARPDRPRRRQGRPRRRRPPPTGSCCSRTGGCPSAEPSQS